MKFITTSMEDTFNSRVNENVDAKKRIAYQASKMIETGRSLFLDSGTTVLHLAYLLPDERITITTTGPNIALELAKKNHPIVNIVGGMLNRDSISVAGNAAQRFIEDINIDIAFIVPSGVSLENGLTSGNYIECELKSMVVNKARRTVVLMDHSKLDRSLPYTFCRVADVDCIVTDRPLPAEFLSFAKHHGVSIVIA